MVPGHEGVGVVERIGNGAMLHDGSALHEGMPVVWERSLTCGKCCFCLRNQRFLCTERKVYGINISSKEPPHLSGNYATHILLRRGTIIYPLEPTIDPAAIAAATCSGATAAHAHEYTGITGDDAVLIYGSGPVAAFQVAFGLDAGAKWISVITRSPGPKADIIRLFGPEEILYRSEYSPDRLIDHFMDRTDGIGVDVVVDTTPDPKVFREAVKILRRGGVYVNPGMAIPSDPTEIELYSDVVRKNLSIRGVWASDSSHLEKSLELVQSGKFPFDKLVTHRFPLEEHEKAWRVLNDREGMKVVFEP